VFDQLGAVGSEDVDVRGRPAVGRYDAIVWALAAAEQAVFVPPRLAHGENEPRALQRVQISCLVGRVSDRDVDVDDRLGGQAFDGGGADVIDAECPEIEEMAKPLADLSSLHRRLAVPCRIPASAVSCPAKDLAPASQKHAFDRESLVQHHTVIDPAILYFGTPVALLSSVAADGTPNTAPMPSIFWLGQTALLGMGGRSRTAQNLLATGECVINLPTVDQVAAVDTLALTTGRFPVPEGKTHVGYRYEAEKMSLAGLHSRPGDTVRAERIDECPVNLEARIVHARPLLRGDEDQGSDGDTFVFEAKITRVHVHESIRLAGTKNRIDPNLWRPLIMSFQRFYGLGAEVHPSRLAETDEEWYR
jgi:flavin reductase (DIM6/NTAB) family NADH-FMN oxidoreductase RutF